MRLPLNWPYDETQLHSLVTICKKLYDDDDVYLKKITTRVSQNLILYKNADQPKE
jgi:hypothetical protein